MNPQESFKRIEPAPEVVKKTLDQEEESTGVTRLPAEWHGPDPLEAEMYMKSLARLRELDKEIRILGEDINLMREGYRVNEFDSRRETTGQKLERHGLNILRRLAKQPIEKRERAAIKPLSEDAKEEILEQIDITEQELTALKKERDKLEMSLSTPDARADIRNIRRVLEEGREAGTELEKAKEIFGEDYFGPEAVEETFGVKLTPEELGAIKYIPCSAEELEKARKAGMMLILRVSRDKDGQLLTLDRMRQMLDQGELFAEERKVKTDPYLGSKIRGDTELITDRSQVLEFGWELITKGILPGSTNKTFKEQEEIILNWALAVNHLHGFYVGRRYLEEALYDELVYYGATGDHLLSYSERDRTLTFVAGSYNNPSRFNRISLGEGIDGPMDIIVEGDRDESRSPKAGVVAAGRLEKVKH